MCKVINPAASLWQDKISMFSKAKRQGSVSDLLHGQLLRRDELICRKEILEMVTDKEGD